MSEKIDLGEQAPISGDDYGLRQGQVDPKLRKMFLNTFKGAVGEEVLIHILNMCDYFTTNHQVNPEKIMIAQQIMYIMGVTDEKNISSFINSALNSARKANLEETSKE